MRPYRSAARRGSRFSISAVLLFALAAAAAGGAVFVLYRMLTAGRPEVVLGAPFSVVGRSAPLVLTLRDAKHGLSSARITLRQGEEEHVLLDETYDPPRPEVAFRWSAAEARGFKLAEGPGRVEASARNASWGGFGRGRTATLEQEFTARLTPPRIEVLTTQHYVNQGGADMIVYRVTPPEVESGVVVGQTYFRGFPLPGSADPKVHFALFAYPYDAAPGTSARLRARDEANNETLANFHMKVFPRRFRSRTLVLDDGFLGKVVPEILSESPEVRGGASLIESYVAINRDLRRANNQALADLAGKSARRFLWSRPFQQLGGSKVEASFADHRSYVYGGREVDRQDHLGYDLATTAHAPVAASNDGVVLRAGYFGIYGNTVVLDHGYGLLSLYGHLSRFDVAPGDAVTRGQEIGRTGATGLAGGDHLHFSMVLQDVQVDPREWWDPHWIEDRVMAKLRQFGRVPEGPAEADPASPAAPGAPAAR